MKKVIRLTESDLVRLVKRVVKESEEEMFATSSFHKNKGGDQFWLDTDDVSSSEKEIEFPDVREFGPDEYDSFMEYINNCDTKWCLTTKKWYDLYSSDGGLKVGRGKRMK